MTDKTEDGTIIQFLHGTHSFEGVWFHDHHPTRKGAFWWRQFLPKESSLSPKGLSAEEEPDFEKMAKELIELWVEAPAGVFERIVQKETEPMLIGLVQKCSESLWTTHVVPLQEKLKSLSQSQEGANRVYKALYNPCIHESSDGVISVHRTKEGAEKAIQEHEMRERKEWTARYEKEPKEFRLGFPDYMWWGVHEIEVKN